MLFPLYDLNPHRRFPWLTLAIIAVNVGGTLWMTGLSERAQTAVVLRHGFVPARLTELGRGQPVEAQVLTRNPHNGQPQKIAVPLSTDAADVYPTLFTTMFLHGGWLHLLTNMWMLWIFGNNIEDRVGHLIYPVYYLVGGIVASLCHWYTDPNSVTPVVGASGAVAAVLGGYAITFPTAKVRTLVFLFIITIIDLPALVLLGMWFALQLASGVLGLWQVVVEPVAFWAHVGGFVTGLVLMPFLAFGAPPPGSDWRKEADDLFRFDDPRMSERKGDRETRRQGEEI